MPWGITTLVRCNGPVSRISEGQDLGSNSNDVCETMEEQYGSPSDNPAIRTSRSTRPPPLESIQLQFMAWSHPCRQAEHCPSASKASHPTLRGHIWIRDECPIRLNVWTFDASIHRSRRGGSGLAHRGHRGWSNTQGVQLMAACQTIYRVPTVDLLG